MCAVSLSSVIGLISEQANKVTAAAMNPGSERRLHNGAAARWEHYPHGADVGVRGIGPTIGEAFEQAAVALAGVITDPSRVEPREMVAIHCEAPDAEVLLVDWLNALIFEMAVRRLILARFRVRIEGNQLFGQAWGEPADVARHEPAVEVKGATYTDLFVGRKSDGAWIAQCIVDV